MKIKFGSIVTDGRNKIGGHVASKNKAGNYLKTKSTPTNPRTITQQAVRSIFTNLSQAWRGLTQAQRDGWISGAPNFPYTDIFGDTKVYSGFGLFMKLNGNLLNAGSPMLEDIPTPSSIVSVSELSVDFVPGTSMTLNFEPTTTPVGTALVVQASSPLSNGKSFSKSTMRKLKVLPAATTTGIELLDEYTLRFGAPEGGLKIYFSAFFVLLETGQVSQSVSCLASEA